MCMCSALKHETVRRLEDRHISLDALIEMDVDEIANIVRQRRLAEVVKGYGFTQRLTFVCTHAF